MTKKLYITFALLGSLLITSCDSFLDIQPIGKVIPNTLSEYRALLTEAYSQPLFDRGVTEFRTDEVTIRDNEYDQTIIRKLRNGTTLILFPVHVNLLGAIIIALSIMPTP